MCGSFLSNWARNFSGPAREACKIATGNVVPFVSAGCSIYWIRLGSAGQRFCSDIVYP